jgi:hypothetical protein
MLKRMSETDPETGCSTPLDKTAYELCRQTYYTKQQNQILQNQQSKITPTPEESTQPKTDTQTQVEKVYVQKEGIVVSPTILYVSVLIVIVIATIFITKYFTKK